MSIVKVNSFRHKNHDIVSCTDSLAGPGRPCLLSPVNGRHLESSTVVVPTLPRRYLGTYYGTVLRYLTDKAAQGRWDGHLVIWGSFCWLRLVNGYQRKSPAVGAWDTEPLPQPAATEVVQTQSLCELGRDSKRGSHHPTISGIQPTDCKTLTSIYLSVRAGSWPLKVHHSVVM